MNANGTGKHLCELCGATDELLSRRRWNNRKRRDSLKYSRCTNCIEKYGSGKIYVIPATRSPWGQLLWSEFKLMVKDAYAPSQSLWRRPIDGALILVQGNELEFQKIVVIERNEA